MAQNWSFWERDLYFNGIDYAIIGGGIVGMTTSIFLKREYPNAKVVIIEKKFPGLGASTKNAGFACFGSVTEVLDDLDTHGEEEAFKLLKMRWEGLSLLKGLLSEKEMDYAQNGSHELFEKKSHLKDRAFDNFKIINDLACDALKEEEVFKHVENRRFTNLSADAIYSPLEGQLNPVSMMHALQLKAMRYGVKILYGIEVEEIQEQKLIIKGGDHMYAEDIIVCTNGFAKKLIEISDVKMVRNQVMITRPIYGLDIKGTYHMDSGYIYFREYMGRLLIGGARNLQLQKETTGDFGDNPEILKYLQSFVKETLLPDVKLDFDRNWSGILGVGSVKSPIIKKINNNLYVGIRLGGMGVAIGSYVGRELSRIVD